MREKPENLEEKKETFIRIATAVLKENDIPAELVINCDETGFLFVSRANYTYARQGAKRVRLIGVGKEKPQYTATISITESGDVLSTQLIFKGKTSASHPGGKDGVPPDGIYYEHTETHWQTEISYIKYIQNVILPYKNRVVREMNLPANQKCILKHDLHYSHKDKDVLQFMKENGVIPLFVPAGCTDWMQECDLVANATLKRVVRDAFRDHLYQEFDQFMTEVGNEAAQWTPNLNVGHLKPYVPVWIQRGLSTLMTNQMKQTIADAFAGPGCIGEARRRVAEERETEVAMLQTMVDNIMLEEEADSHVEEFGLACEIEHDDAV